MTDKDKNPTDDMIDGVEAAKYDAARNVETSIMIVVVVGLVFAAAWIASECFGIQIPG